MLEPKRRKTTMQITEQEWDFPIKKSTLLTRIDVINIPRATQRHQFLVDERDSDVIYWSSNYRIDEHRLSTGVGKSIRASPEISIFQPRLFNIDYKHDRLYVVDESSKVVSIYRHSTFELLNIFRTKTFFNHDVIVNDNDQIIVCGNEASYVEQGYKKVYESGVKVYDLLGEPVAKFSAPNSPGVPQSIKMNSNGHYYVNSLFGPYEFLMYDREFNLVHTHTSADWFFLSSNPRDIYRNFLIDNFDSIIYNHGRNRIIQSFDADFTNEKEQSGIPKPLSEFGRMAIDRKTNRLYVTIDDDDMILICH